MISGYFIYSTTIETNWNGAERHQWPNLAEVLIKEQEEVQYYEWEKCPTTKFRSENISKVSGCSVASLVS